MNLYIGSWKHLYNFPPFLCNSICLCNSYIENELIVVFFSWKKESTFLGFD